MKRRVWLVSAALLISGLVSLGAEVSPASAAECTPLDAAAIEFGSPRHAGQVPALSSVCFALPVGTTNALSLRSWSDYSAVRILDSLDQQMCVAASGASAVCALAGTGPYRIVVDNEEADSIPFDFSAFSLGTCPDAQVSGFGSAAQVMSGSLPAGSLKCHDVALSAGTHLLSGFSSGGRSLVDAASGQLVCSAWSESDDLCDVATSGVYSLLVGGSMYDSGSYALSIVDVDDTSGCSPVASTSWTAPALVVTPFGRQWDCQVLSTDPGDRVVIGADSGVYDRPVHLVVLDATDAIACVELSQQLGCTLTGTGPYRIVTGDDVVYRVAVRSLGDDADCPVIAPRAFGAAAGDTHPGVGCRRFEAVAGHGYFLRSLTVKGQDALAAVYGPDLVRVGPTCDGGYPLCTPAQDGTHWVISSVLGRSTVTAFADLASTSGCRAQSLDLAARSTDLGVGEFSCDKLDLPKGSTLGIVRDIRVLNEKPVVTVVDSTGETVCSTYGNDEISLQRCLLATGTGPYRAIVGVGTPRPATSTAYLRLDKPAGCAALRAGKSVTVKVSAKVLARCYVASANRKRNETLTLTRRSGRALAELGAATRTGGVCSPYVRAASMSVRCLMIPVSSPFTVVVTGNRKAAAFALKRG